MVLFSYLKHLLIYMCDRMAGHQVGIALTVWIPGDAGLSLGLLWLSCIIIDCGSKGYINHYGLSAALCIREGDKDQGLTTLLIGASAVPIISSAVSIVVVHSFYILTTKLILVIGAP